MHGLQLSLAPNPCCSHDIKDESKTGNYFQRGKDANNCHDTFNDPLHVLKFPKLHVSNSYVVKFASNACNYYQRGGDKCTIYDNNNYKLHPPTDNMHWSNPTCCDLFIYKMSMHRKKVRHHCCILYAFCCSPSCFSWTITLIDVSTQWDPGIW